jgi:thioredoxin 1
MSTQTLKHFVMVAAATALLLATPIASRAQVKIVDNVYHITDRDFEEFIKEGVVLIDFWAVWCAPCRQQAPIIDEIAQEIGQKAKIAKMDVSAEKITANRFNVRYIPTIMIFKNGEPVETFVGVSAKETLVTAIDAHQ